jgi:RHS repeat-associated protein
LVRWALADQLGSVRDVVDGNGAVVNHLVYDSFGNIESESNGAVDFRFGYTGREFDEESGQYYYRARYYDAGVGRFLSEDPISFSGGDANLYRYALNRPTTILDPSGLYGQVVSQTRTMIYARDYGSEPMKTESLFAGTARATFPGINLGPWKTPGFSSLLGGQMRAFVDANNMPSNSNPQASRRMSDYFAPYGLNEDPNLKPDSTLNKDPLVLMDHTRAEIKWSKTEGSDSRTEPWGGLRSGDDRGHIVPRELGGAGSPNKYNFFSQNSSINRGGYRTFAKALRDHLDNLHKEEERCKTGQEPTLTLTVELKYSNRSKSNSGYPLRPGDIETSARFSDGTVAYGWFDNKFGSRSKKGVTFDYVIGK